VRVSDDATDRHREEEELEALWRMEATVPLCPRCRFEGLTVPDECCRAIWQEQPEYVTILRPNPAFVKPRRSRAGQGGEVSERKEGCYYCAQGWPLLPSIRKDDPRHSYPKDYKGLRAGFPHCTAAGAAAAAPRQEADRPEPDWSAHAARCLWYPGMKSWACAPECPTTGRPEPSARERRLEDALREISSHRCPEQPYGERCPEAWAASNGGRIPFEEQRRRWCASCIARAALGAERPAPQAQEEE
jgi:hypothetical protein